MNHLKTTSQLVYMALLSMLACQAIAAPLALSNVPLFLTYNGKPNILMMIGNSNTMDGDPTGLAVGSNSPNSKSEIARNAMKKLINDNMNTVNLGLLGYQQYTPVLQHLTFSAMDASYNPADYNPNYTGPRNGQTKKYRVPNPSSPSEYVYYNVTFPTYSTPVISNLFCYSDTPCTDATHDFKGTRQSNCATPEDIFTGPFDQYSCFSKKTGTSNAVNSTGYSNYWGTIIIGLSDAKLAQGATDFGKLTAFWQIGDAWYSGASPGKGYLHIPLAFLDTTLANKLQLKLATSNPATDSNSITDSTRPLQNSGLAPLEGTVVTANNYFNGVALSSKEGGPVSKIPNSCGNNFLVLLTDGLPSAKQDGTPSRNVIQNLADVTTQVSNLKNSAAKVKTYVVGFGLPYGTNPAQLNTIASAGGTDTAYYATSAASLDAAFSSIFSNISAQTASSSAVALNTGSVNANTRVYQAKFSSLDWSGQLLSIAVNANNGTLGSTIWDAGERINAQGTNRNILTYKPSTNTGIAFRWPTTENNTTNTQLDLAQSTALNTSASQILDNNGAARLDYLRGSSANEGSGLNFRARHTSKLGDIVNSSPQYVGAPSSNLPDPTYAAFRLAQKSRTPIIYVGANDGMLHGFNATNGDEVIAYVPSGVYSNLSKLTSTQYAHQYYVDGTPSIADVYYGNSWHTTLVSSMGNGAKGVFGLDVTNPSNFSEANAASLVNFEFPTTTTAPADANDVGYIPGQVVIKKLNNGVWAAIFGNGYNSTGTGQSSLFIVDVKTGVLIKKISTGVGTAVSPNALATPYVVDIDGNNTADVVYAGDLQGNMWKFDISSTSPASWGVSYKLYAAGQPITETPTVSKNPTGDYMVYFGTGQYLTTTDTTSYTSNNFYGIWDHFNGTVTQGDLVQQSVTNVTSLSGRTYRQVSQNEVNYASATPKRGWYINLPAIGERSVNDPKIRAGRIIFTTIIPSTEACSYGGKSATMTLDYLTGGMPSIRTMDTNGDGTITESDLNVGGLINNSISSDPTILGGNSGVDYGITSNTDGSISEVTFKKSNVQSRRTSWRQIQLQ